MSEKQERETWNLEEKKEILNKFTAWKSDEFKKYSEETGVAVQNLRNWAKRLGNEALGKLETKTRSTTKKKSDNIFLHKSEDVQKYLTAIMELETEQEAIEQLKKEINKKQTELVTKEAALLAKQVKARREAGL